MAISKKRSRRRVPTIKAFISYSHEDRKYGAKAKAVFAEFGIEAFLAHEDLEVSDEWRACIIKELQSCGIFVPLLSANFLASKWAPQEVGFIISRPEVAIAPISLDGTTPFGFISHVQGRRVSKEGITRELLIEPLAKRMPRQILPGLIKLASKAGSFRSAETLMAPLVEHFGTMTRDEAQALAEASVSNSQIWAAQLCRDEYLPELLRLQRRKIDGSTLRALQYQVENGEWYRGE